MNEKILVTGVTGVVALPVAEAMTAGDEVWGVARFTDHAAREQLEAAGVHCVAIDLVDGDLTALPTDFTYVLNFAVLKTDDWGRDLDGNAGGVAFLMEHCQGAKAFLHCSSTAVYQPNGHHPFAEDDPLGDNHRVLEKLFHSGQTYSISKIAAEAVARYGARRWQLPTTIVRLNVPYGPNGGLPAINLDMMVGGMPVPVHPDAPSRYNPIHEDDIVAMVPALLAAASVPATIVNWGGEPATIEEWCAYLGEITGLEPKFNATENWIQSVTIDLTRMHDLIGPTKVDLKEGLRRMVEARHPELFKH